MLLTMYRFNLLLKLIRILCSTNENYFKTCVYLSTDFCYWLVDSNSMWHDLIGQQSYCSISCTCSQTLINMNRYVYDIHFDRCMEGKNPKHSLLLWMQSINLCNSLIVIIVVLMIENYSLAHTRRIAALIAHAR